MWTENIEEKERKRNFSRFLKFITVIIMKNMNLLNNEKASYSQILKSDYEEKLSEKDFQSSKAFWRN